MSGGLVVRVVFVDVVMLVVISCWVGCCIGVFSLVPVV